MKRFLFSTTEQASLSCSGGTTVSCSSNGPSITKTSSAVIVGIYEPPSSVDTVYWAGGDYFPYGTGKTGEPTLDAIIATTPTVLRIAGAKFTFHKIVLRNSSVAFSSSIPWNMASVVRNRGVIAGVIASIRSKLFHDYGQQVSTSLPSEMTAASNDDGTVLPIILSIELQVVLLALLVLYVLGRSSANACRLEADFARRRGFPRSTLLAVLAVSEPIALATAALPVGVLIAWLVLRGIGSSFFAAGTSVTLTWPSVAAGVGGYVAAVLAATLASYSLWRRSEAQLSSRRRQCRRDRALDAAGVALALAGLIAVTTSGALNGSHTSPLAAIAPGLLTLGAAIIGLRLFSFIFSLAVRATRGSRKVAWFLAFRQVARRPEMLRRLLPLTAAVGVVLFAIGAYALAAENRSSAASFETGADRVVIVVPPKGANFVSDVRKADPSGHQAMAAALSSAPSGELLAVDSTRLAVVAAWPSRLSRSSIRAIARELNPPTHAAVMFSGSALRLRIYVSPNTPPLTVGLSVYDPTYEVIETYEVMVRAGLRNYVVPLQGVLSVCRLASVNPGFPRAIVTSSRPITFTIGQMSVRDPGTWRLVRFGQGFPGRGARRLPASRSTRRNLRGLASSFPRSASELAASLPPAGRRAGVVPGGRDRRTRLGECPRTAEQLDPLRRSRRHIDHAARGLPSAGAAERRTRRGADGPHARRSGVDPAGLVHDRRGLAHRGRQHENSRPAPPRRLQNRANDDCRGASVDPRPHRHCQFVRPRSCCHPDRRFARRRRGDLRDKRGGSPAARRDHIARQRGDQTIDHRPVARARKRPHLGGRARDRRGDRFRGRPTGAAIAAAIHRRIWRLPGIARHPGRDPVRRPRRIRRCPRTRGRRHELAHVGGGPRLRADKTMTLAAERTANDLGVDVRLAGVVHLYPSPEGDVVALRGVDLDIEAGEAIALLGPSGAGKSTMLSLLAGEFKASAGVVRVGPNDLGKMSTEAVARLRSREISLVVQGAAANLLPYATSVQNVSFAQYGAAEARRSNRSRCP